VYVGRYWWGRVVRCVVEVVGRRIVWYCMFVVIRKCEIARLCMLVGFGVGLL
jgi:hypothetical protein